MRKIFFPLAILLSFTLFTGCQKQAQTGSEDSANNTKTITAILKGGLQVSGVAAQSGTLRNSGIKKSSFDLLAYAILRSGLANELDNPRQAFTLFAPTDDAFTAAGLGTTQAIDGVPVATLRAVLQYHGLGARVLAGQVPTTTTEITMLSGQKAYVVRKPVGVFINGTKVIAADIKAQNGVIHAVNRVLFPPAGNIVEVAIADPNFSYLVAAVVRANLAGALSGSGPLTVFAPTNQAFINAGFPTIEAINNANPADLVPILTYHVTAGRIFSSDLSNNQVVPMLNMKNTTILLGNGAQIDGINSAPSNIIKTDIMATNGVIHVIDRVLLP
jgi:uncharacterized surface protein with fasciclin (FAS1) repeats